MTTLSDSAEVNTVSDSITKYRTAVSAAIDKSNEKINDTAAQEIIDEDIVREWSDYSTNLDKYLDMVKNGETQRADEMAANTLAPIENSLRDSFSKAVRGALRRRQC
jgi:hypothetical protein